MSTSISVRLSVTFCCSAMRVTSCGDGLFARARLGVVELLDQEHDDAGDGHGDAAGREQALPLAARGFVDHFALHAQARLRGDLREVVFGRRFGVQSWSRCRGGGRAASGGMGIGGIGCIGGA